jgi:hypothetical protein
MTSLGSCAKVAFVDAPAAKELPNPLLASMRFGAEADGGSAAVDRTDTERLLSSSALKRPKISSSARWLWSLASSAALLAPNGVFAREVPRFRALPKGPFSSGMRR